MVKVVHVVWKDPCFARSGWLSQDEFLDFAKDDVPQSDSVGILAYENDKFIVLLQSVGANQVADSIKIIRSAICSISEIGTLPLEIQVS